MKQPIAIAIALLLSLGTSAAWAKPKPKPDKPRTAAQEAGVNHVVQRGETLFSIAERYYGNGYEWVKLKEYNPNIDQEHLNIGEIIYVPDPKHVPADSPVRTSLNPPSKRSLFAWMPSFAGVSFFGRSLSQIIIICLTWFAAHFSIQGIFVWFAAHLAFVKDVNLKKALRATLQSESLAFICVIVAGVVGLMLLYVGTTSPGKPLSTEILGTAEEYLGSPTGMALCGILLVALYGFLGIRFIPQAFGIQAGRGLTVVMIAILIPHLIAMYLVGHRMGLID